jgi:hypothetical protein
MNGAKQVCAGERSRPRSLLQLLIPRVMPAAGQTNPLTSRTCLPTPKANREASPISRSAIFGPQRFDECHRMAAPGATARRCGWCHIGSVPFALSWGRRDSEKRPHRWEGGAVSRAQQTVLPDLDQVGRQAMRQKPADECRGTAGAERGLRGRRSFGLAGDLTSCQGEAAVMAEGHPKDIGSQILEGVRAGAHRVAMPHPVLFPDLRGDEVKHAALAPRIAEFGAKDDGKRRDRGQESCSGGQPLRALLGQPPRRHPVVAMGMIGHRAGPGVHHPDHPDGAAAKPRIAGARLEGRCGRAQEGVVAEFLGAAGQCPQRLGHGQGHQDIGDR